MLQFNHSWILAVSPGSKIYIVIFTCLYDILFNKSLILQHLTEILRQITHFSINIFDYRKCIFPTNLYLCCKFIQANGIFSFRLPITEQCRV